MLKNITVLLRLENDDSAVNSVLLRFQPIFQEYSLKIFEFTDEFFASLLEKDYLPSCRALLDDEEM